MDAPHIGIAIDIAGPVIMIVLTLIGAVKAWPYRKTDPDRYRTIYKPYKYWGLCIWMASTVIGTLVIAFA